MRQHADPTPAPEPDKPKPEHALSTTLGFDEDDLAANRQGILSQKQRTSYQQQRKDAVMLMAMPTAIGFLLFGLGVTQGFSPALVVVLFLLTLGPIAGVDQYIKAGRILGEAHIAAVTGRIRLVILGSGSTSGYEMIIGDRSFRLNQEQFLAFKNRDPYTIYYAPSINRILSAEWLRDEDNQA